MYNCCTAGNGILLCSQGVERVLKASFWILKSKIHFVCTHPSYNDTNPPSVFFFFLIPIFKSPFSNQAALRFLSEWRSSAEAAPTIVDWQDHLTLDPPWVSGELSTVVSGPVQGKTRMSPIKRLRCFVVGWNNEHSSYHLLLTSEPLKTQRINVTFISKGMCRSPICLNASMFVRT